ncbi:hypothetical protein TGGT1_313418 [Toxoplasma gondii GT1]|uniref:Uncharacterized protein n=1 Tax=Toxoplasma gondii (strain ATCC 50853 / GT1) TaxID=507601 RepID=S7UTF9_TOXGG|nr:hypothetical protein TGGT1_313418 [Toxoplasma gondii GT1]
MRKVDMGTKRKVEKEERKVEKPSLVVSTHLVRGTGEVLKSGLWKTGNSGMGPACLLLTKTETSSAPVQASRRGQVHPREKSLHSHVAANLPSRIRVFLHPQARETYRQERLILSPPSRQPGEDHGGEQW